jgi:hypothetical protein
MQEREFKGCAFWRTIGSNVRINEEHRGHLSGDSALLKLVMERSRTRMA